jgi:sphingomyelin phosphodiesterase acid-like 3
MTHSRKKLATPMMLLAVFLTTALVSRATETKTARRQAATGVVVSISDVHFNPFFDPSLLNKLIASDYTKWQGIFAHSTVKGYGSHKADTNYVLLNSTLENIYQQVARPDFIIISGDFLGHDFQEYYAKYSGNSDPKAAYPFISKTIAFVTGMIAKRFPSTPVYPALGNNDSYCGDYAIEPGGQFLSATAQAWKTLLRNASNVSSFMQTFPAMGSYSVVAPGHKSHRVIVLNSTFFSDKYENTCGDPKAEPGRDEIKWLEQELQRAVKQKERVWMLYHIPPGIDVYASLKQGAEVVPFWNPAFNQQFINLMTQYSPVIVGSFVGHTHMDNFELVQSQNKSAVFVHITPAISPLFGNNPAFEVFSYNRQSSAVKDYSVYYFDLALAAAQKNAPVKWTKEYTFSTTYGQPAVTPAALHALHDDLLTNEHGYLTNFERYYNVSNTASPGINDQNRLAYWCGMIYLTVPEYQNCVKTGGKQ